MVSRNRRYALDFSNCVERFLDCSPKMRNGQQMTTRDGTPVSEVTTLEDVDMGGYQTTDDKQKVLLASAKPVRFPKYAPVCFVNPTLSAYSFRNARGEVISGVTIYVDDVVAADESGDVDE